MNITPAMPAYVNDNSTAAILMAFTGAITTMNNVLTLYLLVWKDQSFRNQVFFRDIMGVEKESGIMKTNTIVKE